jgi:hypothetical protein
LLVEQIDQNIIIALIGVLGGVLPVGITYVFTKRKEINANIREEKTKRYDGLISALVTFIEDLNIIETGYADKPKPDTVTNFIMAYHRSSAYASDDVLKKCNIFVRMTDNPEKFELDDIRNGMKDIYKAIRLDINPKAKYTDVGVIWYNEE